ncbi:hypothetical protein LCGC14_1603140 [marine sediment metagenome]|uniref:Uncharacterized protein n=1 Tax=marine sediment metagenome TaxID=412755 RepID=A0A0F9IAL3_9ZZZZ
MSLRIRNKETESDFVDVVQLEDNVRVAVNNSTILYLHADGRAIFYPKDVDKSFEGRWK